MKSLNGIQAVVTGGATAAFDKQTGAILWQAELPFGAMRCVRGNFHAQFLAGTM